jgi:hypothetical protein
LLRFVWFSNTSKLVQIQCDMNCYDLQFIWFLNMSEHVQTCLNFFRFNMIQVVTIHAILKHVWTCWNMSILVQIQYDTNCYDSYDSQTCLNMFKQTCLNFFRFNMIQIVQFIWFSNMWTCSKMWFDSTNMLRLVLKL